MKLWVDIEVGNERAHGGGFELREDAPEHEIRAALHHMTEAAVAHVKRRRQEGTAAVPPAVKVEL